MEELVGVGVLVWTTQHCGGVSYTESVCTCSDYILVCEAMLRGNCTLVHCYTDHSPCPSPSPRHHGRLTAVIQCECVLTLLWCRCIPSSPPLPSQSEDSESFKTMVVFDCRGVEPFDFSPRVSGLVDS